MKRIQSPENPLIKTVRRLARARKREARFLLEGKKLVRAALQSGAEVESWIVSARYPEGELEELERSGGPIVQVTDDLFRRMSSLVSPEGVLGVARRPTRRIDEIPPTEGLVLAAAGVQDPGNLGSLARVAEAVGASALVVVKGSADPFSPKALRGSMGSLLRVAVVEVEDEAAVAARGFRLAALVPRGGVDFREADLRPPLAVLVGRESTGLSRASVSRAELRVSIPMRGAVESLNVATAAALVLYEAARRRS